MAHINIKLAFAPHQNDDLYKSYIRVVKSKFKARGWICRGESSTRNCWKYTTYNDLETSSIMESIQAIIDSVDNNIGLPSESLVKPTFTGRLVDIEARIEMHVFTWAFCDEPLSFLFRRDEAKPHKFLHTSGPHQFKAKHPLKVWLTCNGNDLTPPCVLTPEMLQQALTMEGKPVVKVPVEGADKDAVISVHFNRTTSGKEVQLEVWKVQCNKTPVLTGRSMGTLQWQDKK